MLRNLIVIAFRNLKKERLYSLINLSGLTIGITCSLFLLMYLLNELSYDRWNKNADQIFRVISNITEPDNQFTWAVAEIPMGPELRDHYPEVLNAVRFFGLGRNLYEIGDKRYYEGDFDLVDSTVFDMFSYEFIEGDPKTALNEPNDIILTQTIAKKYFGNEPALGRTIETPDLVGAPPGKPQTSTLLKVTGVIKDVPLNSQFRFDALISGRTIPGYYNGQSWGNFGVTTYVMLPPNSDVHRLDKAFDKIIDEKVKPIFEKYNIKIQFALQKLPDIHLHSKIEGEAASGGDMSYIYIFAAVAAFMLIIATINYMNLATARSANRSREVGIRKVMGSQRGQLITQFVIESTMLTVFSVAISLLLIYLLLPYFNELANKQLPFNYLLQPKILVGLAIIVLIAGFVGGSYPAFYLSAFNPVNVLKGKASSRGGNAMFRRFLVVVQFSISIFMLISTLVVFDQLQFVREKDLGFDKSRIMKLTLNAEALQKHERVLVDELKQTPGIEKVAMTDATPGDGIGKLLMKVQDSKGQMVDRGVNLFSADYDFLDVMGMQLVKGRNFDPTNSADTIYSVLCNEAMVQRMGWDDPIGKEMYFIGDSLHVKKVIGVVKDYNQLSLYQPIEPLIILLNTNYGKVIVKTAPGDPRKAVAAVEKVWDEVNPSFPFEYDFLDADFNSQYKTDEKRSEIFTLFSGLTIFIACLGLLGLVAFTTQQRTKEIGIRKVIGAGLRGLVWLVSREFFILVAIAIIVAFPVAWYITKQWLTNFAFRININGEWGTAVLAVVLTILITMITVGFHVLRAAIANPVKALREE